MPPRRLAPLLQSYAAHQFSDQIMQVLLSFETKVVRLRKGHTNPMTDDLHNNLATLQSQYQQLLKYLELIPGVMMEKINHALMTIYIDRYHTIDPGWKVWTLTKGVEAREVAQLVTPCSFNLPSFSFSNGSSPTTDTSPKNYKNPPLPVLSSVLSATITPNLTILDFKHLSKLSTVSDNVFTEFNVFLSAALIKVPKLRSLTLCSPHASNSLPQCTNAHLELLGKHCSQLEFLDVSFNKNISGEGIKHLLPNAEANHPGCVNIKKLFIFDCGVFEKELSKIILHLPELSHLGYKETGKTLKSLLKSNPDDLKPLKLTHVDNLGSKSRRLIASAMRCKKPVVEAILNLCPNVENVKLRVNDDDVANLTCLKSLTSVELVYHVGNIGSPGTHTQTFLSLSGHQLSSIALICNTMTMSMLVSIAENCPGLTHLWSRSNHMMASYEDDFARKPHSYLLNLKTLYFRVGEGELSVSSMPEYVLFYLLKNAKDLRELIVATRSNMINDTYVQRLVTECQLEKLEKILFVVPGVNSLPGIIKLTINTVHAFMHLCPNLNKIGNILSWDVNPEEVLEVESIVSDMNYDLEIVNRKMTMR